MSCTCCHFIISYSMPLSFLPCKMGVTMALSFFPKKLAAQSGKQCPACVYSSEDRQTRVVSGIIASRRGRGGLPCRARLYAFCGQGGCLSCPPNCFLAQASVLQRLSSLVRQKWDVPMALEPNQGGPPWTVSWDRLEPVAGADFTPPEL